MVCDALHVRYADVNPITADIVYDDVPAEMAENSGFAFSQSNVTLLHPHTI